MSLILIPARYSSSRLPAKVLADISGKPMIVRVVEQCMQTVASKVAVVTDDRRVAEVVGDLCDVVMTGANIKTGTDRIAIAAKGYSEDVIINVQGDEPFIPPQLIDELIMQLKGDASILMNTACVRFKDDGYTNPSHVKVVFDENQDALYFSRSPIPYNRDATNDSVDRYRHIGIYGFKRDFLFTYTYLPVGRLESIEMLEQLRVLENGYKIKVIRTDYEPISVDTQEDLEKAIKYYNSIKGEL